MPVSVVAVLTRISISTICRSDIHSYLSHRPNPCPGILGHEIVGVVEQLGANITRDMRGEGVDRQSGYCRDWLNAERWRKNCFWPDVRAVVPVHIV